MATLDQKIFDNVMQINPFAQYNEKILGKWGSLGLLDGINDPTKRRNLARLLENEAVEIALKQRMLKESSETTDIKGFQAIAFSVVRRFFGGLLANEIVSVQPLSVPAGLLFYIDFKYATVKAGNTADDFATGKSLYGDQNAPTSEQASENLGTGAYYDYNVSFSRREIIDGDTFTATANTGTTAGDVDYDPDLADAISDGDVFKLTVTGLYDSAASFDPPADRTVSKLKWWVPLSSSSTATDSGEPGIPVRLGACKFLRKHTKRSGSDVLFFFTTTDVVVDGSELDVMISYVAKTKTTADSTGLLLQPSWESDFADPSQTEIPEIDIKVASVGVVTETRKLKVRWSQEVAQDLSSFLSIDPEIELTKILSESMAIEIDREIMSDIFSQASAAVYHWSRIPGRFLSKTSGAVHANAVDTYVSRTQREWYETLVETILDVGNQITRKTLRGFATFCVVNPEVATMLEATLPWKLVSENETTFRIGVEKIGSLQNRIAVYKDPYCPKNQVLVGYKGESFLDTGYVHAPYIPLLVTPTIFHPEDFTPRKMVMSRYANRMIRSDFYGKVIIHDMDIL